MAAYKDIKANLACVEYEEISLDGGETWSRTGKTRPGRIISEDACECSTIYEWFDAPGYICENNDKYRKRVFMVKNGCNEWQDVEPQMVSKGALIEEDSTDCGFEPEVQEPQYRDMSTEYCDGDDLVRKTWKEILVDPQIGRWSMVEGTEEETVIQEDSSQCIQPQYRTTYSDPYCEGMAKYKDAIESVSYDKGVTWEERSRTKTLVSESSTDCAISSSWKDEGDEYCDGSNVVKVQRKWFKANDGKEYEDTSDEGVRTVVVDTDSYRCIDYGCPSGVAVEIISGWTVGGSYDGLSSDVCGFVTQSDRDSIGTYKVRIHFNENGTYRIMYDPDSLANIGAGDSPNNLYLSYSDTALTESTLSYALVQVKNSIRDGSMDYNGKSFVDVWFVKQSADAASSPSTTGKVSIGIQKIR